MQIKTDLSRALSLSIIPSKTPIPILSGIKITADKDIKLTTTNLEISKIVTCPGTIKKKGSCVVNGKMLLDIFKTLDTAELELKETELIITSGKTVFKIPTMDEKDFPEFPAFNADNLTLDGEMLLEAITKTIKAVSQDTTRPVLTGANLEIDKEFTFVATDSYRLAKYSSPIKSKVKIDALIPLQSLEDISKLIDGYSEVEIAQDNNLLKVETDQTIFITRLIEGQFPNHEQLLPKECKSTITCDKAELTIAIKQAELMSDKASTITIENSLTIYAASANVGESKVEVNATGEMEKTSFNAQFFLDGLANVNQVQIEYNGPSNPCILKDHNYLYMIMPVRVQ